MQSFALTAPAKINLALHVTGQRPDGYHLLDSVVAFTALSDRLRFSERGDDVLRLTASGPFGAALTDDEDNLVFRAARALRLEFGIHAGAQIELEKRIPIAAGLGGGSADAAATLIGLDRLWELNAGRDRLMGIGERLGADVPMCLMGRPLRATGIGERLKAIDMPSLALVLANPMTALSTPAVFAALEDKTNAAIACIRETGGRQSWNDVLRALRNDLEVPAARLEPAITACLQALDAHPDCHWARMSGSGATCFGVFASRGKARMAAERIRLYHPDWWCIDTHTLASPKAQETGCPD